jgi:hypothetical protein
MYATKVIFYKQNSWQERDFATEPDKISEGKNARKFKYSLSSRYKLKLFKLYAYPENMPEIIEPICIPEDLSDAIIKINGRFDKDEVVEWVPIRDYLWNNIMNEERLGNIYPGQNVLELGSGSGDSLLTWSYTGYPVTGIELSERLFNGSLEAIAQNPSLVKAPIKVFHGSYYTKTYLEDRKRGSLVQNIEKEYIDYLRAHGKSNVQHLKQRFRPVCESDVYDANGIDMKKADIWYAYQWTYQAVSTIDMFRKFARDDAVMLMISKWSDDIALRLGMYIQKGSNIIRKKPHEGFYSYKEIALGLKPYT